MSAGAVEPAAVEPTAVEPTGPHPGGAAAPRARRRRWLRAAIPLATAAAVLIGTAVTYEWEQPDPTDRAFLSPVSDEDVGARRLADRVRAAGVTVRRETRTADALVAAEDGGATLLIPAPSLVHRAYLRVLSLLPAGTRVVLVEPRAAALRQGRLPVTAGPRRLAAAAPAPSTGGACDLDPAVRAGPAAVTRQRYDEVALSATEQARCYDGGLLVLRWAGLELVLVGAADPFRNDRIGERGNATLATGLLTDRPNLIWLDLHAADPPPYDPSATDPPDVPPTLGPGEDEDGPDGERGDGDGDRGGDGDGGAPGDPPTEAGSGDAGNPLFEALPAWFWALLAQLALAALLLALWRGRRLGPPVAEPLPVIVRSAETVRGRGRLYQRARARGPALDILRGAARTRLVALLALPPDAGEATVVEAAAARSGRSPDEVRALLYGPAPTDDEDLVRMARGLDALTGAVRGDAVRGEKPQ